MELYKTKKPLIQFELSGFDFDYVVRTGIEPVLPE